MVECLRCKDGGCCVCMLLILEEGERQNIFASKCFQAQQVQFRLRNHILTLYHLIALTYQKDQYLHSQLRSLKPYRTRPNGSHLYTRQIVLFPSTLGYDKTTMVYPDTNNSTEARLKVSSGGPYRTITMQVLSQRAAPKYGQL